VLDIQNPNLLHLLYIIFSTGLCRFSYFTNESDKTSDTSPGPPQFEVSTSKGIANKKKYSQTADEVWSQILMCT
jgi:hypothetical protein